MQVQALVALPLLASAAAATIAIPPTIKLTQAEQVSVPSIAAPPQPAPAAPVVQTIQPVVPDASSAAATGLSYWYVLKQNARAPFATYSTFLLRYRGWPGETGFRKNAEGAIDAFSPAQDVVNYFQQLPPLTATGRARYAFALYSVGQTEAARDQARQAWRSGLLAPTDENRLLSLFSGALSSADYDSHMDLLLDDRDVANAYRLLGSTTPVRRPIYEARISLQGNDPNAAARIDSLGDLADSDAGLLMDRARWLRDNNQSQAARQLLAKSYTLSGTPGNAEKWLITLLSEARAAAADNQWTLAYQIASQADKAFPAATDISLRSTVERDNYTSLVWLAGTAAYRVLRRPADATSLFVRYARGGRSTQVIAKGYYWAGRAAQAAGQPAQASAYFEQAAAHPELFYGQLSLERLARPVPAPAIAAGLPAPTDLERQTFAARDLVAATRLLGQWGRWEDQSAFVRALAEQTKVPSERVLVAELSSQISRPDLAVWLARNARNAGSPFYARECYPQMRIPESSARYWSLAHGIMRQESSFDRAAVSPVGARGMMQLMPGTARQTADKLSTSYDLGRLTSDPSYNIMLGSAYFGRLMDYWGGYAPLAVASYNAGIGNVRKWIANNGDPRTPGVDIVAWIEDIPFQETRGYVQRVLENTVVYDTLNPARTSFSTTRLSFYLGKSNQPG
jgi:soluble lytic murein transglycosylase